MDHAEVTSNCGACDENVKNEDCSIQCEGLCAKWYHIGCVSISPSEYNMIEQLGDKLHWFCDNCNVTPQTQMVCTINELNSKVNLLVSKVNGLQEENVLLKELLHTTVQQNAEILRMLIQKSENNYGEISNKRNNALSLNMEDLNSSKVGMQDHQNEKRIIEVVEETKRSEGKKSEKNFHEEENIENGKTKERKESFADIVKRLPEKVKKDEDTAQIISSDGSRLAGQKPSGSGGHGGKLTGVRSKKVNFGTGSHENSGKLKAAPSTAYVYVGHVAPEMSEKNVISYLGEKGITEIHCCEPLPTLGRNKAFKIGVHYNDKEKVLTPSFWPQDISFRPFRRR